MTTHVHLTPEQEHFARSCVESGRFHNLNEVVRSALCLLQEGEERRARFQAMLDAVREETARDGGHALEDVMAEADRIIQEASCAA
ncbi:MAG: type II toxin-antitoxin system ParD family antitoxin [Magnetococcales bacterium]|nr:type II toxin-antitoxin system ParD family antitoxin [Magnetococcales bacterium]